MMTYFKEFLKTDINEDQIDVIFEQLESQYQERDPWGLDLQKSRKKLTYMLPLYKNYFKTRVFGQENISDEPYIVISNHSGQIAIDGMLITMAFVFDLEEPRLLRPLVDRFVVQLPFFNTWSAESGAVLGDRRNCQDLLKKGESPLVFPEGMKGITKNSNDYYKVQDFTLGFFRMAHRAKVKILPITVVGAEEFYPYVYHLKGLAKFLKLPTLPLTPNLVPLPSPVDIHIGKPIDPVVEIGEELDESKVYDTVLKMKELMQAKVDEGLQTRRPFPFNKDGHES